ncbi:MAG: nucleotide exchange factor GrpE [Robiginitomaculum sp.]|nr:nucleotide exchange factor GrpE [Robiginitomaculum sp.]
MNEEPQPPEQDIVEEDAASSIEDAPEIDREAELETQLQTANEQTLRLAAELENVRKRSERAEADARRYAVSRFAEDILAVADNLYRALDNVPPEARLEASDRMRQLVEGVELTQSVLQTTLERNGVKQIDPKGEKFNHNLHQAVAQIPSTEFAAGTVAEVIQHGYVIGDRTLRAAMVAVSSGTPAEVGAKAPEPQPDAAPGSNIDTKA